MPRAHRSNTHRLARERKNKAINTATKALKQYFFPSKSRRNSTDENQPVLNVSTMAVAK